MKPTLVILAAGMGSRYGGLKQIDGVGPNGEAIIEYSIYDAIEAGFGKVVFVIREDIAEAFKNYFGDKFEGKIEVDYVFQELHKLPNGLELPSQRQKPWGTGHAMLMAGSPGFLTLGRKLKTIREFMELLKDVIHFDLAFKFISE
ncbi:MAG: hypothetical protein AAFR87_28980, partial [Bacteroidota bacterium]